MSAPARQTSLAVIIPMYNEESNAERCIRSVCQVLGDVPLSRLFVVNDGSTDRTGRVLERLLDEGLPFTVVAQRHNMGYGAAVMTGASAAASDGFEFGLFMDSDLTNDPALIPRFAEKLAAGCFDLVKASRYIENGGMRGVPFHRRLASIVANGLCRAFFRLGVKDCTNGFRAVRLGLIRDVAFVETGFPVILEELLALKMRGARATEIPYVLTARSAGGGHSKFRYSARTMFRYLKYALRAALVRSPAALDSSRKQGTCRPS